MSAVGGCPTESFRAAKSRKPRARSRPYGRLFESMTKGPYRTGHRVGIAVAVAALVAMALPPFHAANSCEWAGIDRIVAVGDVHGAYDRYVEILKTAGIIDNGGHWSAGKTHFVQLGDVVDRGDDSRKALGRDGEYGRWLRQLPAVIKIDGLVFVHGGISPAVAPLGCAAINDQVRRELTSDLDKTRASPMTSLVARADGPLWYRGLTQEPDTFAPQVTEVLTKLGARAIIVGHTVSTTGRIASRFDGRVIQIDSGMQPADVQGGRASALEIRGGEGEAIYVDRRDPVALPKVPSPSSP